jgi:hypothetical protein
MSKFKKSLDIRNDQSLNEAIILLYQIHQQIENNPSHERYTITQELRDSIHKFLKTQNYFNDYISTLKCPKCGNMVVLKNGCYGQFFGCINFPKCKGSLSITKSKKHNIYTKNDEDYLTPGEFQNFTEFDEEDDEYFRPF